MKSLSEILTYFDHVKRGSNNQYMARCPCHDDKTASLSIGMGEKGIVLHCLTERCQTSEILKAAGLTWRDIIKDEYWVENDPSRPRVRRANPAARRAGVPDPGHEQKKPEKSEKKKIPADLSKLRVGGEYTRRTDQGYITEKITHCYPYTDPEGNEILRVFRTDQKSFPVIHRDADSWYWGDGGHNDLLYRLPKVLAAARSGGRVFITEGEKDVETLESLGLTATTNKGGAGKWTEKSAALNQAMRGACAIIIPDIDEPGRDSAEKIARALKDHAKEVRIVNLKKLPCELPPKGDISDAAQLLGEKTRDELERLIERSPVLSRIVSDEDYSDFFLGIRGCKIQNGCIYGTKNDTFYQMSSFVALPVEQILLDDGLTEPSYSLKIMGWSSKGYRLKTTTVPLDSFDAMQWPMRAWGVDAVIDESNLTRQKLRRIIQEAGSRTAVNKTLYLHTGWREISGKTIFLHGGGAIGLENAQVRLDFDLQRYDLSGWTDELYQASDRASHRRVSCDASLRCMRAAGMRIGAPLVGMMYLTPLKYFLEKRGHRPSFVPFVRGDTGQGKTTITSLILNHFGRDFGFESAAPGTFDDTVGGVSLKLFALKDMPLLIDDYHPEAEPKKAAQMASVAAQVSRMIGDGMRRSRMRSDTSAQEDKPARGLAIETGEQIPVENVSSTTARMYIINVEKNQVPTPTSQAPKAQKEELNALHKLARMGAMSEAMRGYIEYLAARADRLPDLLDQKLQALQTEAWSRTAGMNLHARMPQACAYLMLGIDMMYTYMSQPDGLVSPDDIPALMDEAWDAVIANTKQQGLEMRDESPTEVYVNTIKELLAGGRCVLQDVQSLTAVPPQNLIGYRDEQFYYLNMGESYRVVQKSLVEQGSRMSIGKNSLMRQLAAENKLMPGPDGKHTRVYARGGLKFRAIWLPRWVLDGRPPLETMADAGQTAIPIGEIRADRSPDPEGGDIT